MHQDYLIYIAYFHYLTKRNGKMHIIMIKNILKQIKNGHHHVFSTYDILFILRFKYEFTFACEV